MRTDMIILGIHGYGQSGKDTFADALVENHGFVKIAFADQLRDTLYDANPALEVEDGKLVPLQEVIDSIGWEEAKLLYPSTRQLMISFGEAVRRHVDPKAWVHAAVKKLPDPVGRVVFTDVRNMEEARYLRDHLGAQLVHIVRPGVGPAHPSEETLPLGLLSWRVVNDQDITWLRAQADMLMLRLKEQGAK